MKRGSLINLIGTAIHWWLCENCTEKEDKFSQVRALLSEFYYYAFSLHEIIKEKGFSPIERINSSITSSGKGGIYFINQLEPLQFSKLRSIIALMGDISYFFIQLKELSKDLDNKSLYNTLDKYSLLNDEYRKVRIYFTHLNARIGKDRDLHGVTGALEIQDLGLKFKNGAQGCFYLGFCGDKVFFHDQQDKGLPASPKCVSFGKNEMRSFFLLFKEVYELLVSHKIHSENCNYPASDKIFTL